MPLSPCLPGKHGRRRRGVKRGAPPRSDRTYQHAKQAKQTSTLFALFRKSLAESISRIAKSDVVAERLDQIKRSLGVTDLDD